MNDYLDNFAATLRRIREDKTRTDAWRIEQERQLRAAYRAQIIEDAAKQFARLRQEREKLTDRLARLRTEADDKLDWHRLAGLAADYRAKIETFVPRPEAQTVAAYIAQLHEEARMAGDIHRLRALRQETAAQLQRIANEHREGTNGKIAMRLLGAFAEDEQAEIGPEGEEIRRKLEELGPREFQLRLDIAKAESTIENVPPRFDVSSAWIAGAMRSSR